MTDKRDELEPVQGTIYERLLLEGMAKDIRTIRNEQTKQGKAIAKLKVTSGLWGTIGGSISLGLYALQDWVRGPRG